MLISRRGNTRQIPTMAWVVLIVAVLIPAAAAVIIGLAPTEPYVVIVVVVDANGKIVTDPTLSSTVGGQGQWKRTNNSNEIVIPTTNIPFNHSITFFANKSGLTGQETLDLPSNGNYSVKIVLNGSLPPESRPEGGSHQRGLLVIGPGSTLDATKQSQVPPSISKSKLTHHSKGTPIRQIEGKGSVVDVQKHLGSSVTNSKTMVSNASNNQPLSEPSTDKPKLPTLRILTERLEDALLQASGCRKPYSATLTAEGGDGNLDWSVKEPNWLSIGPKPGDPKSAVLTGIPPSIYTPSVKLQVSDGKQSVEKALSLRVLLSIAVDADGKNALTDQSRELLADAKAKSWPCLSGPHYIIVEPNKCPAAVLKCEQGGCSPDNRVLRLELRGSRNLLLWSDSASTENTDWLQTAEERFCHGGAVSLEHRISHINTALGEAR
jgi:hypothetical protein